METKKQYLQPEEVVEEKKIVEEAKPEVVEVKVEEPKMVELVSLDGRDLEVAINAVVWKGKKITVPADQESQIRNLLEAGGFYVK